MILEFLSWFVRLRSMNKKILIPIVVVLIVVALLAIIRELIYQQKYCNEASAWGALDTSIMLELGDYYRENQRYPDSLTELDPEFSDGATSDMLDQIEYQADGISCKYNYHRKAGKRNQTILVEVEYANGEMRIYDTSVIPAH